MDIFKEKQMKQRPLSKALGEIGVNELINYIPDPIKNGGW